MQHPVQQPPPQPVEQHSVTPRSPQAPQAESSPPYQPQHEQQPHTSQPQDHQTTADGQSQTPPETLSQKQSASNLQIKVDQQLPAAQPAIPSTDSDSCCELVGFFFFGFFMGLIVGSFSFLFCCCVEETGITERTRVPLFTGLSIGVMLSIAVEAYLLVLIVMKLETEP